jgi:hypothetical protein
VLAIIEPFAFCSQWRQLLGILLNAVVAATPFFSFKGAFHFAAIAIVCSLY